MSFKLSDISKKYIIFNNQLIDYKKNYTINFDFSKSIYEVIRIINSKPLFIEEHYKRLVSSASNMNFYPKIDSKKMNQLITILAEKNSIKNGNIKFIQNKENFLLYFINHYYPSNTEYKKGVDVGLYIYERINPNVKYLNIDYKKEINSIITEKKLYELILVDRNSVITEGSKSNIFFIKNNVVYTAPDSSVLKGITRDLVLKIIKELKYEISFDSILTNQLSSFDSAFITGTSPKVLPIRKIDNIEFNTQNFILRIIMSEFEKLIENYLNCKLD